MKLNVNTDASIKLTAKLEKLHRSAFPSAVRNTLNQCAFEMKKKDIPISFRKNFKPKSGTIPFVKKLANVEKANGFKVDNMKSIVGFLNPSNNVDKKFVEGLAKQESGGIVDDGLRYLKSARGDKINGKVRRENYYDKTQVIHGRSKRKGTVKSKFVARAYRAYKENKPMFINSMKGNFLVKVKSISSTLSEKKLNFDFEFIAMERSKKKTNLKSTHFMEEAGTLTKKKIDDFYKKQAEFQFKKYLK